MENSPFFPVNTIQNGKMVDFPASYVSLQELATGQSNHLIFVTQKELTSFCLHLPALPDPDADPFATGAEDLTFEKGAGGEECRIGGKAGRYSHGCSMYYIPRDPITLSEDDCGVQSPPQEGI